MRNQRPKPGSRLALARESRESRGMGELGNVSLSGTTYHPMFSQDLKYSAQVVGDAPDDQVNATISLMRQYALEDSTCPEIQVEAEALRAMNGGAQCGGARQWSSADGHGSCRLIWLRPGEDKMPVERWD